MNEVPQSIIGKPNKSKVGGELKGNCIRPFHLPLLQNLDCPIYAIGDVLRSIVIEVNTIVPSPHL